MSILSDTLPAHMKINRCEENASKNWNDSGKTVATDNSQGDSRIYPWLPKNCHLCMKSMDETMDYPAPTSTPRRRRIGCCRASCKLNCHLICLANYLIMQDTSSTSIGQYIPIKGRCPLCDMEFLWIDLLRNQAKIALDRDKVKKARENRNTSKNWMQLQQDNAKDKSLFSSPSAPDKESQQHPVMEQENLRDDLKRFIDLESMEEHSNSSSEDRHDAEVDDADIVILSD